jgi:hypothetical protein
LVIVAQSRPAKTTDRFTLGRGEILESLKIGDQDPLGFGWGIEGLYSGSSSLPSRMAII